MDNIKIDKLIRSDRKSFSLEINKHGELIVRAPNRAAIDEIKNIVSEKGDWILKKQKELKEKSFSIVQKKFIDGEKFLFLGEEFALTIKDNARSALEFDGSRFILSGRKKQYGKELFKLWYRIQAESIFDKRIALFSSITNIQYNKVKISDAGKRWGSCSSKKNLNFSWRLVMAPSKVIDYVLVHELAHILELNHSKKFWDTVGQMFPDYKVHRKWLMANGHTLEI